MKLKDILQFVKENGADPYLLIQSIKTEEIARQFLIAADSNYAKGTPILTDSVYDVVRLHIDTTYPDLSVKIGHKLDDDDVKLPVPMASLNQYRLGTDVLREALASDVPLMLGDKLDGQSVEIVYRNSVPVEAYTRGDALYGKCISHHLPYMNIPRKLDGVKNITVRTEAIIELDVFNTNLHTDVGGSYKAARNCVSGLTRTFQPMPDEFSHIRFVAFGVIGGKYSNLPKSKQLKRLAGLGFDVVYTTKAKTGWTEDLLVAHYNKRMKKSPFELDGIVLTYDIEPDVPTENNPSEAFKFKMNSEADSVIVTVRNVRYQESKYKTLTPVIEFDPTPMVGGVVVEKATGHNAWYVLNGELAVMTRSGVPLPCENPRPIGVGAKIRIVRSGRVIPYVVEIIKPAKKPCLPEVPYEIQGVDAVSIGESLEPKIRLLESFFQYMEFKDQGESTARLLVEAGYSTVSKIFKIKKEIAIALIKPAKGKALRASVRQAKAKTNAILWYTAIAPYYMQGSAKLTFEKILEHVPEVLTADRAHTADLSKKISEIRGIKTLAPALANTIVRANKLASKLNVNLEIPVIEQTSDKLHGLIAGFSGIRDKQLKADILEAGGAASDSVTNSTTVLIVKDTGADSSKIKTARARGIPIVTPAQFRAQYLGN